MSESMCQACLTQPFSREITADEQDRKYRLCSGCAIRLEYRALRPLEWYRLATLYGPLTPLLHDDFYDEDGRADQNELPVAQAALFPVPKLSAVSRSVTDLLDYAVTRWHLRDDVIAALSVLSGEDFISGISNLEQARPNPWVRRRCYEIAARVLGPKADEWIEACWERGTGVETLSAFLDAVAACSSSPTKVERAINAVEQVGGFDLSIEGLALSNFHSQTVLGWVEQHVKSPVSERWGWIAGCSAFSWTTAQRWLDVGRPLSLVALDALANTLCPPTGRGIQGMTAGLAGAPPLAEIIERLRSYEAQDPVPRVTIIVEQIAACAVQ